MTSGCWSTIEKEPEGWSPLITVDWPLPPPLPTWFTSLVVDVDSSELFVKLVSEPWFELDGVSEGDITIAGEEDVGETLGIPLVVLVLFTLEAGFPLPPGAELDPAELKGVDNELNLKLKKNISLSFSVRYPVSLIKATFFLNLINYKITVVPSLYRWFLDQFELRRGFASNYEKFHEFTHYQWQISTNLISQEFWKM